MNKVSKNSTYKKNYHVIFELWLQNQDDTFLHLHEQIYLMSQNNKMCDRKERLLANFTNVTIKRTEPHLKLDSI